jgi:hypothetical protein
VFHATFRRSPRSAAEPGVTRRAIFRLGGATAAGAAAATAASIATAGPAAAGTDGDVVLGSVLNETSNPTGIRVDGTVTPYGLAVTDNGANSLDGIKPSIFAHAKGMNFVTSIYARAIGPATGVLIKADRGQALAASTSGDTAIVATNTGSSPGMLSESKDGNAVEAISVGAGGALNALTSAKSTRSAVTVTAGSRHPAILTTGTPVFRGPRVPAPGNGPALAVQGVASFTRSGAVTLGGKAKSVTVAVPGGLTASSHVLATMQTNTGTIGVRAAVPNLATGKVTIYLTGTAPKDTKIAWFVFG